MTEGTAISTLLPDPNVYRRADPAQHHPDQPLKCNKCGGLGGIWVQRALRYVRLHRRHHYVRWQGVKCDDCTEANDWPHRWPLLKNTELVKIAQSSQESNIPAGTLMKECIIEMEDKPETSFTNLITLKCAHSGSVCFECMHNYITSQLDSGIEHIKCPVLGCDEHMEAQDIQRQTDDRGYLRYLDQALRRYLSNNPDFRYCLNPTCGSGHFVGDGEETFDCDACGSEFCMAREPMVHHPRESCAQYEDRMRFLKRRRDDDFDEEEESKRELKRITKRCPNPRCGMPIQKNDGCNHMDCTRCHQSFCWICLRDYTEKGHQCPA